MKANLDKLVNLLLGVFILLNFVPGLRAFSMGPASQGTCEVRPETSAFELRQAGGEVLVAFTKNCTVKNVFMRPEAPWVKIGSVDEPGGSIMLKIGSNPGSRPRSTRVYVSFGEQKTSSVGVKQSGNEKIYYAACNSSHPGSWFGPDRELESEAKSDAADHERRNQGHQVVVLTH